MASRQLGPGIFLRSLYGYQSLSVADEIEVAAQLDRLPGRGDNVGDRVGGDVRRQRLQFVDQYPELEGVEHGVQIADDPAPRAPHRARLAGPDEAPIDIVMEPTHLLVDLVLNAN